MPEATDRVEKKRKLQDVPELEIDVSAPEPQSKKALRLAKKNKTSGASKDTENASTENSKSVKASDSQPKRSPYGIWVGNMVFSTTQKDLVDHIVKFSELPESTITRVNMSKGPEKFGRPQNKGFAYVDFSTREAQDTAVEKVNETLLTGRPLLVKPANNFEGRPDKSQVPAAASGNPPSRRIYVGNLSYDATKESLEEHFGRCGTLTHVHVATFQDSGKCRGFAWVEFEDLAIAESAVKGFVMVKDEDEEEEEEEESDDSSDSDSENEKKKNKAKKPKMRKIWVNNHLGRRIRMEFAEDAQTRYKKRFGKDSEGKKNNDGSSEEQPRMRKPRKQEVDESRYSKETVQRLSGAIVEGQGKKLTFD
ncbi:RNA binding protein Rnp24 [Penicillium hetheringtonii]|uniref:RNA binding protein Rnp24 n=1 Tax=Penicillium hetheringtonii TaxID=911720 RepID=A0AAD6DBJ6_9EURO|nr:RNA binding protein Rnp24 [Penicillium hetheringtonii]